MSIKARLYFNELILACPALKPTNIPWNQILLWAVSRFVEEPIYCIIGNVRAKSRLYFMFSEDLLSEDALRWCLYGVIEATTLRQRTLLLVGLFRQSSFWNCT